jgi:hypothetical protein
VRIKGKELLAVEKLDLALRVANELNRPRSTQLR